MNPDTKRDNGLIVVGVDSSPEAKEALRFALGEAKLRQATLRVVHAWQFGDIGASGIQGGSPVVGGDSASYATRRRLRSTPRCTRWYRTQTALRSSAGLSRARPRRRWSRNLAEPNCSSSGPADTADLPGSCLGRSASSARTMRHAQS